MAKLEKFDCFKQTPRTVDNAFFKAYKKPPLLFGKSSFIEKAKQIPLVYGMVVQASRPLYSNKADAIFGEAVFIYTLDESKKYDINFLDSIKNKIINIRDGASGEFENLSKLLNDENSMFYETLPKSLTENIEVICQTYPIVQSNDLPDWVIPDNNILPLYIDVTKQNKRLNIVIPKGEFWAIRIDCKGNRIKG